MPDTEKLTSWATDLVKAFKRARSFDYFYYPEDNKSDPLWVMLDYADPPDKGRFQADLIRFARDKIPNPTDSDVLLMAFGLLKGYENITAIGERRRFCLKHSDYFKHEDTDKYKKYLNSKSDEDRNLYLKQAEDNLRKREDRIMEALAATIEVIPDLSAYISSKNYYLLEVNPDKALIPEPSDVLKIREPESPPNPLVDLPRTPGNTKEAVENSFGLIEDSPTLSQNSEVDAPQASERNVEQNQEMKSDLQEKSDLPKPRRGKRIIAIAGAAVAIILLIVAALSDIAGLYVFLGGQNLNIIPPVVVEPSVPITVEATFDADMDDTPAISIIDSPSYGSQIRFASIKKYDDVDLSYSRSIDLELGQVYEVLVYYDNDTIRSSILGEAFLEEGLNMIAPFFPVIRGNSEQEAIFRLLSTNTPTRSIWDGLQLINNSPGDILIWHIPNSTTKHSHLRINDPIPDDFTLSSKQGIFLNYYGFDGATPLVAPEEAFGSYVTFRIMAVAPSFSTSQGLRINNDNKAQGGWTPIVNAKMGDYIDILIEYENTSGVEQNNIVIRNALPDELAYVEDSTILYNSNYPVSDGGVSVNDGVATAQGINIGNYAPGATAMVKFSARVVDGSSGAKNISSVQTVNQGERTETTIYFKPAE